MKLPEKPINWMNVLQKEGDKVFKLIKDKNLFKKIIEFNKRYLYWDELKYRISNKKEQKYLWTLMKFFRSEKYENILYKPKKLMFVNLPEINRYLHRFDKSLAGNIEVQSKTLGLEKRYVVTSLMEEAIASSMIEGAITTRKIAKEMLKQKRKPRNKNEQMVVNGYETMQMISKKRGGLLTPEFLLEIQTMITRDTLEENEDVGKFRDNNDIVVGHDTMTEIVYHVPPDYKKVEKLIKELCNFVNKDDEEFVHPIIKGIALHFLIGYIHPFNDGNGRTARSVFYWYILSKGYWLCEYLALSRRILRSKKDYGLAYLHTEYDEFDLTYFIKYNLEAIDDALSDLLDYLKLKQKERKDVQKIIEKMKGLNFRQVNILKEMMENPEKSFTIQEISETYHIVYQTARTDLLFLVKLDYAIMSKVAKKFVFKFNPQSKDKLLKII